MELRHLRYFVAVAEELNFRRAAERLNISQPPLSMQIAQLEQELGARLFDRSSQRVNLTMAGRIFLGHARDILAHVKDAARDVRLVADGEVGEIRIGYTQSSEFLHVLPAAINEFRKRYPKTSFTLEQMRSAEQLAAIAEQRIDIGIFRLPEGDHGGDVELIPFYEDPPVLAVREGSPLAARRDIAMRDLEAEMFISTPTSAASGLRDVLMKLCRNAGYLPRIVQEAREVPTILGLAAAGIGIAVVPSLARRMGVDHLAFLPIRDPQADSTLYVGVAEGKTGRLVLELRDLLVAMGRQG
ncbi:LysR family transcriptional regulator [Rhizorhabdus wittichii]|uniref:LysR family transcriptional regulator n=1 Tax=Rhizorhabdus wittichii TaxID=160791 RepID=A0A975HCD4_9SPHN|nr:LysR substrate-binding domain-containing protein [Rhizorhabdus wittichii]QTH20127.1 LysR family transcriptional regulator [Rhizorhabdus wittichii]